MRSDAPLIRHLSRAYNPKVGFSWQRLPYVELDPDTAAHVMMETTEDAPWERVFEDVVFTTNHASLPGYRGWIRVTSYANFHTTRHLLSPYLEALPDPALMINREINVFEMWARNQDGVIGRNPVVLVGTESPDAACIWPAPPDNDINPWRPDAHGWKPTEQQQRFQNEIERIRLVGSAFMAYLSRCPEYLVEETPEVPQGAPPRRRNDSKPWTYNYLPRIILLDPTQAPSGEPKSDQGGTHASPRPHQRRGHWATLKASRFYHGSHAETHDPKTNPRRVFVKPAWVGPRSWVMQGNRYRVLDMGRQA